MKVRRRPTTELSGGREGTESYIPTGVVRRAEYETRITKLEQDGKRTRRIVTIAVAANIILAIAQSIGLIRYTQAADALLDALQALSTLSA